MSKLTLDVRLLDTNAKIGRDIMNALLPDVKQYFNARLQRIEDSIPDLVVQAIMSEPEYSALIGGALFHEFGIPDPAGRLSEILATIRNGTSIDIKSPSISGNTIKGGFKFKMVKQDFSDLLSLGGSSFITEKGSVLNLAKMVIDGRRLCDNYRLLIFCGWAGQIENRLRSNGFRWFLESSSRICW